jgi:hypothetical protein
MALGLLFAPTAWTAPAIEYYIPPPLTPQLSSDGNSLYYAAPPVVYVADPNPSAERVLIPARLNLFSLPEMATATFSITYVANGGTDPWGANCTTFPEQAKNAFNAAAAIWGKILQSSVPITISACWSNLDSVTTLGYAGGGPLHKDFAGAPRTNTWYKGSLANALAGSDLSPTVFGMHITYNSNFSWYYGTDGNPASTQHDLMTVILHEIAHGLNFSGSMTYSGGTGSWGYGLSPTCPNTYDTLMRDGLGNQLTDTGGYGNPSTALGTALTSNNIWFHGSNAMAANGGQRVKIYAPSTWAGGSSYSHMDYNTFHGTANQLMVYAISKGDVIHDPGPIAKGILKDVGWPDPAPLYFPHIATSLPWQTEIAIINTSPNQPVTGTLRGFSDNGQLVDTKAVTLSARGRRQIIVADEFSNHTNIGYIIFDTNSDTVQGYTKFYIADTYRAAIPAVKEVNTSNIYIPHIASSAQWWTGVSLVNTTSTAKQLTITFNNGLSVPYTLNANEHRAFDIASLFNNQPQPDIQSAVITNASGVIGLELFGSNGGGNQLDGILLTDKTVSTLYYPHVASDNIWWTGIVAYAPPGEAYNIGITAYSAEGTRLFSNNFGIAGYNRYIGLVSDLGLPAQTAWFKIGSTRPITGFELFGTFDGNQLAAYAGGGGTGAREGVFAKIEKNGWTGIAFVNTEATAASVTLTAYNDNGTAVATQVLPVGGYAKVVNFAETIFSQNISGATYIAYSSDRNVVGFQLNGTSDCMMLDGLPGLGGAN